MAIWFISTSTRWDTE